MDSARERGREWPARIALRRVVDGLQIRYDIKPSAEECVSTKAWRDSSLEACPNHPNGGCSLAGHGTFGRKTPTGARVPRWYCPESHTTSLADCLATRTLWTLWTLDAVEAAPGVQEAARQARPGHHISSRWAERTHPAYANRLRRACATTTAATEITVQPRSTAR